MNGLVNHKRGRMLNSNSSEECKFLYEIYNAIENLTVAIYAVNGEAVSSFIVGTTPGAPIAGDTTWQLPVTFVASPAFYKNGSMLTYTSDYTFNLLTQIFTLATGTFTNGDTYSILY